MKVFKKITAVLMALAMAAAMFTLPVKAEAADAKKYVVEYDTVNSRWAYSTNDKDWSTKFSDITDNFAKGDILVIESTDASAPDFLITVNAEISTLAISGCKAVVTATAGVDYFYTVNGATGVVNGNVKKAECYSGTVMQINGECEDFTAFYANNGTSPVFTVTGTVAKATVLYTKSNPNTGTIYNVKAGKFTSSSIGGVWITEDDYSTTPSTGSTKAADADEYDSVPKTGYGLAGSALFFVLSAGFAVAGLVYKKKNSLAK